MKIKFKGLNISKIIDKFKNYQKPKMEIIKEESEVILSPKNNSIIDNKKNENNQ